MSTSYDPATIALGASVAHAGTCLTVVALPEAGSNARWYEVEAWEEALRLTTIGSPWLLRAKSASVGDADADVSRATALRVRSTGG